MKGVILVLFPILLAGCNTKYLQLRNQSLYNYEQIREPSLETNNVGPAISKNTTIMEKIDASTYKLHANSQKALNALLTVLVKNYNINILETKFDIISTEWDTYYVNNELFRNKITIKLNRLDSYSTQVNIINKIEKYDKPFTYSISAQMWVPYKQNEQEIFRVMDNVTTLLQDPNDHRQKESSKQISLYK